MRHRGTFSPCSGVHLGEMNVCLPRTAGKRVQGPQPYFRKLVHKLVFAPCGPDVGPRNKHFHLESRAGVPSAELLAVVVLRQIVG
jgi:hypothetical protein